MVVIVVGCSRMLNTRWNAKAVSEAPPQANPAAQHHNHKDSN